jgi:hypothetical protein
LRRRVRHLEHDLRDITARCHAERERHLYLTPCLSSDLCF